MSRRTNGLGTITYRARERRWEAKIDIGRDAAGRRRRRSVFARTRREVLEKLAMALGARASGTLNTARAETLGAFLARWIEGAQVRPSTRGHYRRNLELHVIPTLGRVPLARITAEHVEQLLRDRAAAGLSAQSVHHVRAVLRNALGKALRLGLITRNPVTLTDAPRVPGYEPHFLTIDEARRFVDAARGDRLEALFSVALALGLRQGEALGLAWEHVDLERRTLRVAQALQREGRELVEPKTERSKRALVIPDVVVRALRAHRTRQEWERRIAGERWRESGLVFTTLDGRPLAAGNVVRRNFRRICERAGIAYGTKTRHGLRFHDLRHSAATLLLAQGVPQRVVMEQLGHSTLAMAARYTHVVPSLMDEAAAAMDRALGS